MFSKSTSTCKCSAAIYNILHLHTTTTTMGAPNRWEPYSNIGEQIEGTRFLAFKVPLKVAICNNLDPSIRFTPEDLVTELGRRGSSLGLVIDLTNTKRYYNPIEITKHGVKYEKIFTEGHQVPSIGVIKRFRSVIDKFCADNPSKECLIGVHCTHGVNRTGYLICRYMIERLKFSGAEAIKAFNVARGHDIERENYITSLTQLVTGSVEENDDSENANHNADTDLNWQNWNHQDYIPQPHAHFNANTFWQPPHSYNPQYQYAQPNVWDWPCSAPRYQPQPQRLHGGAFYRNGWTPGSFYQNDWAPGPVYNGWNDGHYDNRRHRRNADQNHGGRDGTSQYSWRRDDGSANLDHSHPNVDKKQDRSSSSTMSDAEYSKSRYGDKSDSWRTSGRPADHKESVCERVKRTTSGRAGNKPKQRIPRRDESDDYL